MQENIETAEIWCDLWEDELAEEAANDYDCQDDCEAGNEERKALKAIRSLISFCKKFNSTPNDT